MYNKLVLSGGGNCGYCYIGVLKSLEEHNINNFKTIMGTSIGSFFATLITMNFTAEDILKNLHYELDYNDIDLDNFLTNFGFYEGNEMCDIFKKIIKLKYDENITFLELHKKTHKKLIITALCLEDKEITYFSFENFPNLKIIDAIRFSISLPFIFTVKEYNQKHYIDAAVIDNLSITYFKNTKDVLGIKIKNKEKKIKKINTFNQYINLLYSSIRHNNVKNLKNYKIINININHNVIDDPINFKLDIEKIKFLINIGYQTTNLFIKKNN